MVDGSHAERLRVKLGFEGCFKVDSHEKRGRLPHPNGLIEGFSDALGDCGLVSLPMIGYPFTWDRGKGTVDWVEERLDRVVACMDWLGLYDRARVYNIRTDSSDHSALFMDIYGLVHVARPCSFRFENAWLLDEGCRGVVEHEWASSQGLNMQARLVRRDPASLARFAWLDSSLNLALSHEEAFWRQRAKQHWLCGADRNTKYFHKYASHRKKKNFVEKLKNDNGVWQEGQALESLVTSYYKQIFASGGSPGNFRVDSLQTRVTEAHNAQLLRPFEPEEVRAALFSMGKDKSPGPDDMNPGFYQAFWDVIGKDITSFLLNCLSQSTFPDCLNDANIVLIPKKCVPEHVSDLRLIGLCNVIYKIMTKMLANRMKPLLEDIISDSQSAFLPGRLISDNILIASEVGHYLRRKQLGQVGWAALKLDMAKAYDRMEWSFVSDMLVGLGFDAKWVQLIMLCIQTVRYRVLINGRPTEEIVPTRGLRQGDPLSPYLFIICAEDDSLLFFKANLQEELEVKRCLGVYESFSGQAVNFHKSSISFSRNTHAEMRDLVSGVLTVSQAEDFGKYLGLPSVVGRNRRAIQIPPFANRNFFQWTEEWLGGSSGYTRELQGRICGILHSVWVARNTAVWEYVVPRPALLLGRHAAQWIAWMDSQQTSGSNNTSRVVSLHAQSSIPPPSFKCYIDVGFHGSQHAAAYGFVVYDSDSSFVAAGSEVLFVNREANHVAHSLSKHTSAVAGRTLWRDTPPSFIEPLVANAI
ncbi:PREDICTED: uncharacterized protein LOC109162678 [Ipomoea nil]|uniref:uncharacterized protein LOC109162678 n=1 Tax=Ipomoea nil TaxID=35883 RepID=UPI000901F77C|nr:PREDICTED: uncharacterized protein LOC109162678 [Ipomoea nil]